MIVVDTNLVVHLVLPGERSGPAEGVLLRDREWAAPALLRSEFRNVLVGWMRRGAITFDAACAAARNADFRVRGRVYSVPSPDVLELARGSRCTAYDCEFVALARLLGVRLVTSDRQVLAAFPETAVSPEAFLAH